MTQDTPTLRSRFDASVDEFEASKRFTQSASDIPTDADSGVLESTERVGFGRPRTHFA